MPGDTHGNSWSLRTGQRLVTVPQAANALFHSPFRVFLILLRVYFRGQKVFFP